LQLASVSRLAAANCTSGRTPPFKIGCQHLFDPDLMKETRHTEDMAHVKKQKVLSTADDTDAQGNANTRSSRSSR
jgi:hypothetical protein